MKQIFTWLVVGLLVLAGTDCCYAQSARYELGRRLKAFELAWEKSSSEQRPFSTSAMESAVERFFGLQLAEAGRALDEARGQLDPTRRSESGKTDSPPVTGSHPDAMKQWVDSLSLVVQPLLADSSSTQLRIEMKPFYKFAFTPPAELKAEIHIYKADENSITWGQSDPGAGQRIAEQSKSLPVEDLQQGIEELIAPLPEGDYWIQLTLADSMETYEVGRCMISRIQSLEERLANLKSSAPNARESTEAATIRHLMAILDSLKREQIQEIDYPAVKLIRQAEALLKQNTTTKVKQNPSPLAPDFSGTAWLRLNGEKSTSVVRIYVPPRTEAGGDATEKRPVLFAFHGAGGSENMFFETYGAGRLVELAAARGWIVVAPRQSLMGGIGLTAEQQLEVLSDYFPIDRSQIYFAGHSMGAGQLIQQVQFSPKLPIAVAAMGGGQRVGSWAKESTPAWFVAAGERDFGKRGALALRSSLEQNGHVVAWQEYQDVEHMVIVQAALNDVFAFFDKATPKQPSSSEHSQENPK